MCGCMCVCGCCGHFLCCFVYSLAEGNTLLIVLHLLVRLAATITIYYISQLPHFIILLIRGGLQNVYRTSECIEHDSERSLREHSQFMTVSIKPEPVSNRDHRQREHTLPMFSLYTYIYTYSESIPDYIHIRTAKGVHNYIIIIIIVLQECIGACSKYLDKGDSTPVCMFPFQRHFLL